MIPRRCPCGRSLFRPQRHLCPVCRSRVRDAARCAVLQTQSIEAKFAAQRRQARQERAA